MIVAVRRNGIPGRTASATASSRELRASTTEPRGEDRRRSRTRSRVRVMRRRSGRAVVVECEERDRRGSAQDREQHQETAHGLILPELAERARTA